MTTNLGKMAGTHSQINRWEYVYCTQHSPRSYGTGPCPQYWLPPVCMGNTVWFPILHFTTTIQCIGAFATHAHEHILAHLLCCHFGRPNHLSLLIKHFNASSQFIVPHQHHIAHATSDWWTREWGERSKQGCCQCCYKYLLLTHTVKVHHQTVYVYLSKLVVLMWQVNTIVCQS